MKNLKHKIITLAVLLSVIGLCAFTTENNEHVFVKSIIVNTLDKAQSDGRISSRERIQIDSVLTTGIIDEVLNAWSQSGYDISAAVDKAAEVSVREGWFKNKQTAKKYFRLSIESARKDGRLFNQIYQIMGI